MGGPPLPLFPLATVLLPGELLPLHVFEERYRLLAHRCLREGSAFGVVLILAGEEVGDEAPVVAPVGTEAHLVLARELPDGRFHLLVRGGRRFRVVGLRRDAPYLQAEVEWLPPGGDAGAMRQSVRLLLDEYRRLVEPLGPLAPAGPGGEADDEAYSFGVAALLPLGIGERQELLETGGTEERLMKIAARLARAVDGLRRGRAG